MPGIYQRDNINYGGMLGNAMAQRANIIQRDYENYMKQPNAWAEATRNSGKIVQDAAMKYATYSMDMDKLANQQQFQSEQNALNRAQQLQLAREQQASTERIAAANREATQQQQLAEKQAQNVMHYEIAQGALNSIVDEIMRTDDPAKLAQLYRQRDEQLAKMQYYGANLPENYPGRQNPFAGYQGFQLGMGKDRTGAGATPEVPAETPATGDTRPQSVRYADFLSAGNNAKTSAEVDQAIKNMSSIDRNFLTKQENEAFEKNLNDLKSKYETLKKQEDFQLKIKNWKPGDPVPTGYRVNFVNGQPAGLKKK